MIPDLPDSLWGHAVAAMLLVLAFVLGISLRWGYGPT